MADTQRDGWDGSTNGGSADRPEQGAPLRVPTRVPWRVESPAGWQPGATTAAPVRATVLAAPAGGAGRPLFLPTGTGPARCGRLQAPRGAPAAIGERFGQAIVRHEALGHGRDRLAAGRVEEADGPPRLTVEATWALTYRAGLPGIEGRARPGPLRGPQLRGLAPPSRDPGLGRARGSDLGAAAPKSGGVGLTLWQLLGELQILLACWACACPLCQRPTPRWLRPTGRPPAPT